MLQFIFREGSSVIFSILIAAFVFATAALNIEPGYVGMFTVALVIMIYLALQMGLAAFAQVGQDKPLLDLFFSLLPMITLVVIAVLAMTGMVALTMFHVLSLVLAALAVVLDVVFNTQVVFKMNRLATDMVQMR